MNSASGTHILVFHYKNGDCFPPLPCYQHIWAGKNGSSDKTTLTGDDTGINISDKNKYYSELSGWYWYWKNHGAAIVGTCHYRRFFTVKPLPFLYRLKQLLYFPLGLERKRRGLIYCRQNDYWTKRIITCGEIEELFLHYDVILPAPRIFKYSLETHFNRYHRPDDLQLLRKIVAETVPEYTASFDAMLKHKQLYANNMFILRSSDFDKLSAWIFMLLEAFEKRINLTDYTDYQERIMGFLSERLITTWFLHHKNYRIKNLPLIYMKHLKRK